MKQSDIDDNMAYFAGIDMLLGVDRLVFTADEAPDIMYDGRVHDVNNICIAGTGSSCDDVVPELVLICDGMKRTVQLKVDDICERGGYNLLKAVFEVGDHEDYDYDDVDEFYGYELS